MVCDCFYVQKSDFIMRTSPAQFELMVTFMEQHGDISKSASNTKDRIANLRNWEKLTAILNKDGSGGARSTDKWKKVWTDFKSNTKKKAARLHRAARGTGVGPASYAKLHDIELRVLDLIGVHAATGLAIEEAEWSQDLNIDDTQNPEVGLSNDNMENIICIAEWPIQIRPSPLPTNGKLASPLPQQIAEGIKKEKKVLLSSIRPEPSSPVQPAPSGQTPRLKPTKRLGTSRRRGRPADMEQIAQYFLRADEKWRELKMQQHRDYVEIRREQNRIREMEVQASREWSELGSRAMDLLDKLFNRYCRD